MHIEAAHAQELERRKQEKERLLELLNADQLAAFYASDDIADVDDEVNADSSSSDDDDDGSGFAFRSREVPGPRRGAGGRYGHGTFPHDHMAGGSRRGGRGRAA